MSSSDLLLPSASVSGASFSHQLPDIFRALEQGQIHSIAYWRREAETLDLLQETIAEILLDISEFHGNELGARSIELLTRGIIHTFPDLTPDDIRLFAMQACSGRWKKYGALSASHIMEWLHAYRDMRYREAEEESYIAHLNAKADREAIDDPIIYEVCQAVALNKRVEDPDTDLESKKKAVQLLYEKYTNEQPRNNED